MTKQSDSLSDVDLGDSGLHTFKFMPPSSKPLIWTVQKEDGNEMFIVGTCHLGDIHTGVPHKVILDKLGACDGLIVETQILGYGQIEVYQAKQEIIKKKPLFNQLSQEDVELISNKLNVPKDHIRDYISSDLMNLLLSEGESYSYNNIFDDQIVICAMALDKPVHYIETMKYQIELLDMLYEYDANVFRNYKKTVTTADMINSFYSGDLEACNQTMNESLLEQGFTSNKVSAFISERNLNWFPKLEKVNSKGKYMVAVGSAHLAGEQGLLRLFEKQGYRVRRIWDVGSK